MDLIREDYVLGNKKIVVGDNLHDLVLENLGKIWIRYGNSYKDFSSFVSTVSKSTNDFSKVVIETTGLQDPSKYKQGALVFDAKKKNLYLKYQDDLLLLLEYNDGTSEKYVYKSGDTMTGTLEIDYDGVPFKIKSAKIVRNLNSEFLQGKTPDDFAQKIKDETITGNWTFRGHDIHTGFNEFNNAVDINGKLTERGESEFYGKAQFHNETEFDKTATFKDSNTAIRVGTGDIVTDGSMGSSQFMSGMTGYGWRLDASTNTLTIDNLIVRGILNVFELIVNKISATNGSFWITDSFKVDKVFEVKYLKQSDYLGFTQSNTNIKDLFKQDTYYIPITNDFVISEQPASSNNLNEYPYSTRDSQLPNQESGPFPTFNFLKWMFKILDIEEFYKRFSNTNEVVVNFETKEVSFGQLLDKLETLGFVFYTDGYGYLRCPNVRFDHEFFKVSDFENISESRTDFRDGEDEFNIDSDAYVIVYDEYFTFTNNREYIIMYSEIQDKTVKYKNFYNETVTIDADNNISQLFQENYLLQLAANNIIEIMHVFQKDPHNVSELEEIPNSDLGIFPNGYEKFKNQLFTIVSSKNATLETNGDYSGYYSFPESAISKINLYYKYFGSNLDNGMNIYVLESKHDEYPVFKPGDIIKCQKFTGTNVEQYHALVLGLAGQYGFIIQLQNYSLISQNVNYEYNSNGELCSTNVNIDPSLYERSEGLEISFADYINIASELLQKYDSISASQIDWCLQVLLPSNLLEQYRTLMNDPLSDKQEVINSIISNRISGLTYEQIEEHPIFSKILDHETKGIPVKDDSLVRIGSIYPGDRRNSMYLTSSEGNSPYQDILVDINRPDYTVVYLTPKYRSFEGCFTYEGNTRKGNFYVQNTVFKSIMALGDKFKQRNKTWTVANLNSCFSASSEVIQSLQQYCGGTITQNNINTFKEIYEQYRPYSMLSLTTNSGNPVTVGCYTVNPEHLTYDGNGNIIVNENGLYFSEQEMPIIVGKQLSNRNTIEMIENGNEVQITIGSTT